MSPSCPTGTKRAAVSAARAERRQQGPDSPAEGERGTKQALLRPAPPHLQGAVPGLLAAGMGKGSRSQPPGRFAGKEENSSPGAALPLLAAAGARGPGCAERGAPRASRCAGARPAGRRAGAGGAARGQAGSPARAQLTAWRGQQPPCLPQGKRNRAGRAGLSWAGLGSPPLAGLQQVAGVLPPAKVIRARGVGTGRGTSLRAHAARPGRHQGPLLPGERRRRPSGPGARVARRGRAGPGRGGAAGLRHSRASPTFSRCLICQLPRPATGGQPVF